MRKFRRDVRGVRGFKMDKIDSIGEELVQCNHNCEGISNSQKEGIIPRGFYLEERNGENKIIVVGLNPGNIEEKQRNEYKNRINNLYTVAKDFFEKKKHIWKYHTKLREILEILGFGGDILWTELVKCQKSEGVGSIPIQTFRNCVNRFLKREIELFPDNIPILCAGNNAFEYCSLFFPSRFIVGVPHPTGSYGNFDRFLKRIKKDPKKFKDFCSIKEDYAGNKKAIRLQDLK